MCQSAQKQIITNPKNPIRYDKAKTLVEQLRRMTGQPYDVCQFLYADGEMVDWKVIQQRPIDD